MQGKTTRLETTSEKAGWKMNRGKSKVTRINATSDNLVTVGGELLEELDLFTYDFIADQCRPPTQYDEISYSFACNVYDTNINVLS